MILEKYTKMEHPLLTFTSNEKLITIYESNKGNDIFFVIRNSVWFEQEYLVLERQFCRGTRTCSHCVVR